MELGAKMTVIVFTEETWWPSSNTLSECYNNVDVVVPLWLTEPKEDFGVPAPWSFEGSPATSSTLRLGVKWRRHLCAGDVETPSFVEKLLSGTPGSR